MFTHLSRAEHLDLLPKLAPGGVVLVPEDVATEIDRGRASHHGIASVNATSWTEYAELSEDEWATQLLVKAAMGGGPTEHLGECAVIACAVHRDLVALLDDRTAITQADHHGVTHHDTLWLVVEAYLTLFDRDGARAARVVDDLIATGMYLPIDSGENLFVWAYEQGYLPPE